MTAAEQGLAQRYLAREASSAWLAKRLMLVPAAAALGFGCFVAGQSAGLALGLWLLGAGTFALPYWIERHTGFRIENRAYRLRAVCSSELLPKLGMIHRLNGERVGLPLGWGLCLLAGLALFRVDSQQMFGAVLHLGAPRHFGSVPEPSPSTHSSTFPTMP